MKNSLKKIAVVSLLSVLGLTACDSSTSSDVYAKPTDYSDPVETFTINGKTVNGYKNMEEIYDAWREGNLSSDVLDEILYQYSISAFGRYDQYVGKSTEYSLKEAYEDITEHGYAGISQKTKDFIKSHSAYQVTDASGNENLEDECAEVVGRYLAIEKRICQAMYDLANSGSYTEESIFYESKLLRSLRSDSESVSDPSTVPTFEGQILPSVEPEDVFEAGILTRSYYQSDTNHYVEEKIIPDIYNELLNELYLFTEASGTVGRSRARKINVFSITAKSGLDSSRSADYLVNYLFEVLTAQPGTDMKDSWKEADKLDLFKDFSNAWIGTVENHGTDADPSYSNDILEHILSTQTGVAEDEKVFAGVGDKSSDEYYYTSTDRGDWMKDYEKISIDLNKTDSSIESTYTGSGSYVKEHGRTLKERETAAKDYTSNGWYISSDGVDSLPEAITTRLFNVAVADAKKESTDPNSSEYAGQYDRWQKDDTTGEWTYSSDNDYNSYLAYINGSYYLKATDLIPGSENQDIVWKDGDTYYIVQVLEAVNTTKMGTSKLSYESLGRSDTDIQDMKNEIAKIIAEGSTYQSLAKEYWLKKMAIQYHDTVVYTYFVDNYPDLF